MLDTNTLDAMLADTLDSLDEWMHQGDIDEAVYPIIRVRTARDGRPVLRRLPMDIERSRQQIRAYLFPDRQSNQKGIWVYGPRSRAVDVARSLGLRNITEGERHRGGRRHVHGYAGQRRSEHIYYGWQPPGPGQDFFD